MTLGHIAKSQQLSFDIEAADLLLKGKSSLNHLFSYLSDIYTWGRSSRHYLSEVYD